MKVSIITPTYNSANWVLKTYESVHKQTYSNWEWLVTDDCSSDETLIILNKLANEDPRVRVFSNVANSGAAVSRNNSIKAAQGEFLAFIDSDDLWFQDKLEKQLAFMGESIDFSFTAYELIDENNTRLNKSVDSTQQGCFSYQDMLRKKATLGCSTVMLRKSSFDDITMPLIRTGQDYALWLKLLKTGKKAHLLNEVLTLYRILPDSISRNKIKKAKRQWQIYREIECLGFIESSINFCFYAFRAVFRKS
ncbi:glycosyltransferase family 2 protein [Shewanella inventionis]|uniref:Glycosyl transferase n=1 Tax=Shewanella inventionis TaxID=1738770 RepID=A0ABQ1J944_9GAMM|nr:glycosyltransferase family 2 protein [Shewanella inventionis]MCL1159251.1 glycosyltransferase family 2 protein [Shewanella inventionis]GGB60589.1 glycosyl transferase [Shewanella inventionis]